MAVRIEHHHNSTRFKCKCRRLYRWSLSGQLKHAGFGSVVWREITCECGRVHWKRCLNWQGKGQRGDPPGEKGG